MRYRAYFIDLVIACSYQETIAYKRLYGKGCDALAWRLRLH